MNGPNDIILALDACSTSIGFCLGQGARYIDSGTYRPRGNADERVKAIARWFHAMVLKYNPDQVVIELPTGEHGNRHTDRLLGRVGGNIEGICHLLGIAVAWLHAMKVKATGYSKDKPGDAALLVGKRRVGPDEADAIGLWQAWLAEVRTYHLLNQVEVEKEVSQ